MTREEAIDILNGMFCSLCSLQHPRRSHDENLTKLREIREEALDMAIEALQREDRLLKSLETNEPIYDMVEVVRCKACKWWSGSVNTSHNNHLCKRALDQNVEYWTRGDDFCSYGERKGGEDE